MAKVFRTQRRIEFCETDAAGIAHFSSFFLYMEQAEHSLLRSLNSSVFVESKESGTITSWPRVRVECDYKAAVRFEELIDIQVTLKKVGTKSVVYQFLFEREGEAIAVGLTTAVHCHIAEGKLTSIAIPEPLRTNLMEYLSVTE